MKRGNFSIALVLCSCAGRSIVGVEPDPAVPSPSPVASPDPMAPQIPGPTWVSLSSGTQADLYAVVVKSSSHLAETTLLIAGDGLLLRSNDGVAFQPDPRPGSLLRAASSHLDYRTAETDFFAVGQNVAAAQPEGTVQFSLDGGLQWQTRNMFGPAHAVFSSNLATVVGGDGFLISSTDRGEQWSEPNYPSAGWSVRGLWGGSDGTNSGNFLIIGVGGSQGEGDVLRSSDSGVNFSLSRIPVLGQGLRSIWGRMYAEDLYTVGAAGEILHSTDQGTNWSREQSGTSNDLNAVRGFPRVPDLYAVGAGGTILHSKGDGAWQAEASGTSEELLGVWPTELGDVYAVGRHGTVLHKMGFLCPKGASSVSCDPATEFCFQVILTGRRGDAPQPKASPETGCNPIPTACQAQPSCDCIQANTSLPCDVNQGRYFLSAVGGP